MSYECSGHAVCVKKKPHAGRDFNAHAGDWESLAAETAAATAPKAQRVTTRTAEEDREARSRAAVKRVQDGQLSRARRELCAPALAPGTPATLQALTDPEKRPPRPSEPLGQHELDFQPPAPLQLDPQRFADALRSAPRGSSGALSGMRFVYLKLALDDEQTLADLTFVSQRVAQANMPSEVQQAFRMGRMTPHARIFQDAAAKHAVCVKKIDIAIGCAPGFSRAGLRAHARRLRSDWAGDRACCAAQS